MNTTKKKGLLLLIICAIHLSGCHYYIKVGDIKIRTARITPKSCNDDPLWSKLCFRIFLEKHTHKIIKKNYRYFSHRTNYLFITVQQVRVKAMKGTAFIVQLASAGNPTDVNDLIKSALFATINFPPSYRQILNKEELLYVLGHELAHLATGIMGAQYRTVFNEAKCDAVSYLLLKGLYSISKQEFFDIQARTLKRILKHKLSIAQVQTPHDIKNAHLMVSKRLAYTRKFLAYVQ